MVFHKVSFYEAVSMNYCTDLTVNSSIKCKSKKRLDEYHISTSVPMGTSEYTVSNKDQIASTFTLTVPISMHQSTAIVKGILSTTLRSGTSTTTSTMITSTKGPSPISSSVDATKYKLSLIPSASSSSSIFSAHPTSVQEVSFSIPKKASCRNSRNTNDGFINNIRSIIIISGVIVFTLLIVLAALLYRCVYQNQACQKC